MRALYEQSSSGARSLEASRSRAMNEDEATRRLGVALDRLHAFAASFLPADVVDHDSKLTGDDLHVILDHVDKIHRMAMDAPRP